jgi:hypothetical protein
MSVGPQAKRGRRESRASDAPAASYAKQKSIRASHHRFTGSIRPSLREWFYGLFRALPGEPGFFATIPARCEASPPVDASVGASGPHVFAVREKHHSSIDVTASTASRLTFRDDSTYAPLVEAGRPESLMLCLPKCEAKYFSPKG